MADETAVLGRPTGSVDADLEVLGEIERRVLWLSTRIIDAANHDRENAGGIKVGGHQASTASLVTAMTALWFAHLDTADRVAVKPHASPAFHAIQYLLGNLDRSCLTTLRAFGGLQAYPSRTKDPDRRYIDFSTGSVGLGAVAPLMAAVTRRYVEAHFGPRPRSRFIALLGDAELDEGNVWEAIADPVTHGLGSVLWIVDFNRQSLDRVVPGVRIAALHQQFEAAGWHVVEVKYGTRLTAQFQREGGAALRSWIDEMANEHYQSLFALHGAQLRERFLLGAPREVADAISTISDDDLRPLVTDLGGHDIASMLDAYRRCDEVSDRPSIVFAYTVKGVGLPIAGNPRNHSALLTTEQIDRLRADNALSVETEWDRLDPESPAGRVCSERAATLARPARRTSLAITVPEQVDGRTPRKPISTQEAFGRLLGSLSRDENVAPHLVTVAPDIATTTNLAGFINKMGVFAPSEAVDWLEPDSPLRWKQSPTGQHIELGISEMNLFLLLGQLGLSWDLSDQPLLPIGTVYDTFINRGLDAFVYGTYSGSGFVIAGTPSGVTLAPEGGAHQSTFTPSIGLEMPNITACEPAYASALEWLLCDALRRIAAGEQPPSTYLRLSTRPIEQDAWVAARERLGNEALRAGVLAGGYRLLDASESAARGAPVVHLAASGAVLPETLAAAHDLIDEGIAAHVVDVTSLDRLYSEWHTRLRAGIRDARGPWGPSTLRTLFTPRAPIVTVHDAASHTMAWLGSALGVHCVPLGVDSYGQSGTIRDLYEAHDLVPGAVVNAALAALAL